MKTSYQEAFEHLLRNAVRLNDEEIIAAVISALDNAHTTVFVEKASADFYSIALGSVACSLEGNCKTEALARLNSVAGFTLY